MSSSLGIAAGAPIQHEDDDPSAGAAAGPTAKSYAHDASANDAFVDALQTLVGAFKMSNDSSSIQQLYLLPSASLDSTTNQLEGVVATLAGDAPAKPLVDTLALGTGTTWMRVTAADGAEVNEAAIVKRFEPLSSAGDTMRVSLVSGVDYPDKAHYVVVEGNDRTAAEQLRSRAQQATVEELLKGPLADDYQALVRSSYERRLDAASAFMSTHSLELDKSVPTANHLTHYIDYVHALSRPSQSSRQRASNTFVAYLGASDPSTAHGGAMVYRGPIAGYTLMRAREPTSVKGQPSLAWSNAPKDGSRPFSMFSASTGRYVEGSGRAPDRHKSMNDRVRAAHSERVRWSGAVRTFNPHADAIYHAANDAHWIDMSSQLGAPPGGAVSATDLHTVVAEVPSIETDTMSLDELANVLANSSESELRVSTASALSWLAAHPKAASLDLASIFATQRGQVMTLERPVIEALHKAAAAAK